MRCFVAPELDLVNPKALAHTYQARRPGLDEGVRACVELWPDPGIASEDSDACPRASVLLEGEGNRELPLASSIPPILKS